MSVSIDEKVVEMRFNNRQFEQGIQSTIKSIGDLNKATEFTSSKQNVKQLQTTFNKFDLRNVLSGFEALNKRVSTLGIAGAEVIRRITDSAIDMGHRIESIIMKPVSLAKSGGIARALNIEQAKFQLEGLGVAWEKIQGDIEYGVNDTAYGLDAAAKVASQLVASNVKLGDEMKSTLRGISGVAAMTGSTYEDIGNIFTTVAGNGKLMTIQLHQLAGRGLNIAAELAKQLGKSEAEIRTMVTAGKIDFKTFAAAMDSAFGQHAKDANKTFTGAMSNIKAALSRIGALFAQPFHQSVIAPLNSMKNLINTIKEALVGPTDRLVTFMDVVGKAADKIMKSKSVIATVKNTTKGIANVFKFLGNVVTQVANAFITVFPPKTVQELAKAAKIFKDMTGALKLTQEQMNKIQNVARGVFSVFSTLGSVIGLFFDIIKDIAHSKAGDIIGRAVQAIANGLQTINYFVKVVRAAYNYSSKAFGGIGGVLKNFGTFLKMIFETVSSQFDGARAVLSIFSKEFDVFTSGASKSIQTITEAIKKFASMVNDKLGTAGENIKKIFSGVADSVAKTDKAIDGTVHRSGILVSVLRGLAVAAKVIVAVFGAVLDTVADLLKGMDWGKIIEEGLSLVIIDRFTVLVSKISSFMKNLQDGFTNTKTTVDGVKSTLGAVSGAFREFQKSMQIGRIVLVAGAIAILSLSLLELSKIGSLKELGIAIAAMGSISSILVIMSRAFDSLGEGKFIKKGAIQIVLMAAALKILSGAFMDLSTLNFDQVANGAVALAATMAIMVGAFNMMASTSEKGKIFTKSSQKWVKGASQLILMAAAVKILASAVVKLGKLNFEELKNGLIGMGACLGGLSTVAMYLSKLDTKVSIRTGLAVMGLATALVIVSKAVQMLGALDINSLAKGLVSLTIVLSELGFVAAALGVLEANVNARTGLAMMSMAAAVVIMSRAVERLGALDVNSLMKGLIGLTGSMTVVAGMAKALSHNDINERAGIAIDMIAIAISSIAKSVESLGKLDVDVLQKGLIAAGAALVGVSSVLVGMVMISNNTGALIKGAAAMVVAATALGMITSAVAAISVLTTSEFTTGLGATVVALIALSTAAMAMKGAMKGAAALVVVAAAFDLLAPAIVLMGSAPIDTVAQALQVLGVVVGATALQMLALGIGAKVLKKSAATIASLSVSMLIGAAAFTVFAGGALILVKAIEAFLGVVGQVVDAGKTLFDAFANLGKGIANLFVGFFEGLEEGSNSLFSSIGGLIIDLFSFIGDLIKKHIPEIVSWAFEVIIEFIEGIGNAIDEYLPKLLEAIGGAGKKVFTAIKDAFSGMFDELSVGDIAKIGLIIAAITIMFRSLSKSITQIKPANIAGAIILVGGVIAIAFSLIQLSSVPWDSLLVAVGAMELTMLTLTYMMNSLSGTKFDISSVAAMAVAAASLIIIGKSLSQLSTYPWKQLLAAGAAISMVMLSYGAIFRMVAGDKTIGPKTLVNIGLFALGTLSLLPVAMALKELSQYDWKNTAAAAAALTATFIGYAGVFMALSAIPLPGAIAAIANLAIAIVGLAGILLILGAIKQIPGVDWLVDEGASFASKLGEAIGGFVGSIVAGFGKAISSILPQIGSDLSAFWTNAETFFVGISTIGPDTMNAVQSLAGALMSLTATEIVQGIAGFFGADIDFKGFGQQLSDFADGMVEFGEKTSGLDAKNVEKASNAAKMLGEFAGSVPLKGGLLSDLMGDRDLKGFAEALPTLGEGLAEFGKNTKNLDNEAVEGAVNAAKMIVGLNQDLPLQGGLLGLIMGNRDLSDFGDDLPALGEGLSDFAEKVDGLDTNAVTNATTAAQTLAALNQNIPLQGGLLGLIMGNRDLSDFGDDLPALGKGLKEFATNVTGMDTNAATNAGVVARMLGALAADIPNEGGIVSWFTGDSSLESFGEQLPDFGTNIKQFADNIRGMDTSSVSTTSGLINTVINMLKNANTEGISASYVSEFSDGLGSFGSSYKQFLTDIKTDTSSINAFSSGMDGIIKVIKKINKVDTSKIKGFTKDLKGLTDAGIKNVSTASNETVDAVITALNNKQSEFKTAAEGYINTMKLTIETTGSRIKNAMITVVTNASRAAGSEVQKAMFVASGKNMVDGFVAGMSSNEKINKVVEAAKNIARKAKESINKELDIHSPSKEMEKSGLFAGEGFALGIESSNKVVKNSAKDLVDGFKNTIGNGITNTAGSAASKIGIGSFLEKIGIGSSKSNKKKNKKKGESTGKDVANGIGSSSVTKAATNSGKKIGSGVAKGIKISAKDIKKALEAYNEIMGVYTKKIGTAFSQKNLIATISKKGKGNLKVTSKYILSGINNKYLRTAASKLGSDLAKSINDAMRKELKKSDKSSEILEKLDKAGKNLVSARRRKKEAKATINNSKSTAKQISKARKQLSSANKDILKYQKQVEKYEKQLKKAGSSVAKTLTRQAIGELYSKMDEFKKIFNSMDKSGKIGNTLVKIPNVLNAYLTNVKSSSSYAKGVIKVVEKVFASNVASMDKATTKQIKTYEKKLKEAQKKEKAAKKILNNDKASKKSQKKAKKDLEAAQKTIININKKIAKERAKLGGAGVVDKFAERLYYNSEAYADEVKNVKASTKKIKKIQKEAKKYKNKLDKATKAEDKKKYIDKIKDLNKQYKEEEKLLKKSATNIAKGPEKALKAYKKTIKETFKSMLSIANLDMSPKVQLEGFDKFEKTSNLIAEASVNSDIFAKAVSGAGSKFSIFGDISAKATKSFEFFNGAVSTGINLLERFTKVGTVEKEALFENADSQLEAYEEFYKGIEKLRSRGLSETIVDDLKSQGPEALNYIRGFLSMTDSEISSYNNRISKMNAYGAANYANEIKDSMKKAQRFSAGLEQLATLGVRQEIIDEFKSMGSESAQGYVDSLIAQGRDGIKELNSLYDDYTAASSRSMLEAAQEQYRASLTYDKIIDQLKQTILDPAIIKEIEGMGQEEAIAYGRSILSNVGDIPSLNELYWKSQTNDKTMREQMAEANAEAKAFSDGIKELTDIGVNKDFVDYVKGLGIDEGMKVLQRAKREFGSIAEGIKKEEIELFNAEYAKSKNSGVGPMEVLIENLGSQIEGYDEYTANLDIVLKKLGGDSKSEYFKYLKEMGMDGAEYVEALAQATEDQIQRYRAMIDAREARNRKERAQSLIDSWNSELDTIKNYTSNVALLISRGASQTLIDDLASMDIKEAAGKVEALLDMDQNSFNQWNKQYTQMMNQDVSKLVNNLVGVYAASGNITIDQAKQIALDVTANSKQITVKGSYETATEQAEAYKEGTMASYPSYQEAGTNAGNAVIDSFSTTISNNIGNVPLNAIVKSFVSGLSSKKVTKKLVSAGEAICKGINSGISNKKETVKTASTILGLDIYNAFKYYLSKTRGQTLAKNLCNGIHTIMVSQQPVLIIDAFNIAKPMNDQFATYLNYDQGYYYGSMMALGVANGLESMASRCEAAAARIIQAANEAAAARARIGSPSKLWRQYGVWMGEGLSLGLDASTSDVESSAENVVSGANSALQNALSRIRDGVNDELDLNPVITPILDMSKVAAQARSINSMMESSTIGANVKYYKVPNADETNQNGNVVYNFEQNNYSPKTLSREEIYRQTKNQFAMAREALNK